MSEDLQLDRQELDVLTRLYDLRVNGVPAVNPRLPADFPHDPPEAAIRAFAQLCGRQDPNATARFPVVPRCLVPLLTGKPWSALDPVLRRLEACGLTEAAEYNGTTSIQFCTGEGHRVTIWCRPVVVSATSMTWWRWIAVDEADSVQMDPPGKWPAVRLTKDGARLARLGLKPRKRKDGDTDMAACALLFADADRTKKSIAEEIGVLSSVLSDPARCPKFMAAWRNLHARDTSDGDQM